MFYKSTTLHRLLQSIVWQGATYTFFRRAPNEYGEKTGELEKEATVNALFHNGSSNHVNLKTNDAGMTVEKNTPYLLMAWSNAEKLQLEDIVEINGSTYKVSGKENLSQMNIAGEVSLEVMV